VSEEDRVRWNERYRQERYDFEPPDWLVALAQHLTPATAPARALDLACGPGRNSLYLARLGYTVDAWDISEVALELLAREVHRQGLPVASTRVDLDTVELPPETYDLVLDAHYLDRRLFPSMERALRPGGLLLVHTFLQPPGGRYNPAHALEPGELSRVFSGLVAIDGSEDVDQETTWLLAQRPAA
jgi:tellurite methyltransferase